MVISSASRRTRSWLISPRRLAVTRMFCRTDESVVLSESASMCVSRSLNVEHSRLVWSMRLVLSLIRLVYTSISLQNSFKLFVIVEMAAPSE